MSAAVLGLVLVAAVLHATWNVLAKRASGGIAFIWLSFLMSIVLYTPVAVAVAIVTHAHVGPVQIAFMAGNGALHLVYFVTLQRGYRSGDLSVVYPLARGTGPLIAVALCGAPLAVRGRRRHFARDSASPKDLIMGERPKGGATPILERRPPP